MIDRLGLYDLGKHFGIIAADFGEDLAVEADVSALQVAHELGERRAVQSSGGVDANLLDGTVVALLELAALEGVQSGLCCRDFRERDLGFASPHHALCSGEDVFAALDSVCSSFDSRHKASF